MDRWSWELEFGGVCGNFVDMESMFHIYIEKYI